MCAYIHLRIYVSMLMCVLESDTYVFMYPILVLFLFMFIFMHACMYVCMTVCVCISVYLCVCLSVCLSGRTYVWMAGQTDVEHWHHCSRARVCVCDRV